MGWAGFLSMALFRIPLWLSQKHGFWKLMGCGRNGSFDKQPDWLQWALLEVWEPPDKKVSITPQFILRWWQFFKCEQWTILLEPIEGHGYWDGNQCFGSLEKQSGYEGRIAVLTRATIRFSRLNRFWGHVDAVSRSMAAADGFLFSLGIGEAPFIKQATFSIWESKKQMKDFSYRMHEHTEVIRKTRNEKWYSEEMFVRFRIIGSDGSLRGASPFKRIL
jgi:hypothetical protein